MKSIAIVLAALALAACQSASVRKPKSSPAAAQALAGTYDNHEQVWRAREAAQGAAVPPHIVVSIEPTSQAEWSLWHVHLDAAQPLDATWAMRKADASTWIPHRATAAPAPAFDAQQWTALDACALRAAGTHFAADLAACTAIAPGIGAEAALLPLDVETEGEWLHARLYADQARGAEAREDARLVRWFGGWAAVNGGGPKADAGSRDWHMDRGVRLGSEGGRYPLVWRDGAASGYSLALERLTYREGNVPVLKLSVVDDRNGQAIAYAWANPEATRIGINLGWVQVGLDRDDVPAATAPPK
ncbi:MAG TPA: hypothetical protein VKB52_13515 [Rhodanobacteraceae bacterium]|nr:hypothetical protein [Rhodanobacteraceae bacterium]